MSTDINAIADQLADELDIDYRAARDGLAIYLEQMKEVDGRSIDADALSDDDAAFLAEAYRRGMEAQGL